MGSFGVPPEPPIGPAPAGRPTPPAEASPVTPPAGAPPPPERVPVQGASILTAFPREWLTPKGLPLWIAIITAPALRHDPWALRIYVCGLGALIALCVLDLIFQWAKRHEDARGAKHRAWTAVRSASIFLAVVAVVAASAGFANTLLSPEAGDDKTSSTQQTVTLRPRPVPTGQSAYERYYRDPALTVRTGLVGPNYPLEAHVSVADGFDAEPMGIFDNPIALKVYDVSDGGMKAVYDSHAGDSAGASYAQSFDVPLTAVPSRVIVCLAYTARRARTGHVLVRGFAFEPPEGSLGTARVAPLGLPDVHDAASSAACKGFGHAYVAAHMQGLQPLDMSVAHRANTVALSGSCGYGVNPIVVNCSFRGASARDGVRRLRAGFAPDSLTFAVDIGPESAEVRAGRSALQSLKLPALGESVYASVEYADGSKSAVVKAAMWAPDGRAPAVPVVAHAPGTPPLYVAYVRGGLPGWYLAIPSRNGSTAVAWSRDGQGYTPMKPEGELFTAPITPSELGIDDAAPPPASQPRTVWIRWTEPDGHPVAARYDLDLWNVARVTLRATERPEQLVSCRRERGEAMGTYGLLKVGCAFRFRGANLLFRQIWWGLRGDDLHDAGDIEAMIPSAEIDRTIATRHMSPIEQLSFKSAMQPEDWRKCGVWPSPFCDGKMFVSSRDATTVYVKFRYWDGSETQPLAVPVK
jgi:hypothetical protein